MRKNTGKILEERKTMKARQLGIERIQRKELLNIVESIQLHRTQDRCTETPGRSPYSAGPGSR
jgi:hypothetical protein